MSTAATELKIKKDKDNGKDKDNSQDKNKINNKNKDKSKVKVTKISELHPYLRNYLMFDLSPHGFNELGEHRFNESDNINTVVHGRTPLLWVAGLNRPDLALQLLDYPDIEINHTVLEGYPGPWADGYNALAIFVHYYSEGSIGKEDYRYLAVIQALVKRDPNAAKKFVIGLEGIDQGCNLLHLATYKNSIKLMELFLSIGIEVNSRIVEDCSSYHPNEGHNRNCTRAETSLHAAARLCSIKTVQFLLEAKANVNAQNLVGLTPLDRASEVIDDIYDHCIPQNTNELERKKIRSLLIQYGAKCTDGSSYGTFQSSINSASNVSSVSSEKTNAEKADHKKSS